MGKFQLFSRKTHISHHIARLTSSIMPTLGIIDASIILHSLIALLHCMDFLDNMVGGDSGTYHYSIRNIINNI